MTILKLPNVGDTLTAQITLCEKVQGNFGQQVKFQMANGDLLFVPDTSADRQLLRCGFDAGTEPVTPDYAAVAGNTLTFSRDPNPKAPSKPYWGITVAAPHEAKPKPASKRIPPPEARTEVPGEAPPAYHRDIPLPEGPDDGMGELSASAGQAGAGTGDSIAAQKMRAVDAAYAHAWMVASTAQGDAGNPESMQAGAATLLIAYQKAGAC